MLLALSASTSAADSPPAASISNDLVTARIYLPDSDNGYYRGTRFDWSGVIYSLTHDGHEYFGEWQDSDDPFQQARITGPVDSFGVLGYRPGEPGTTFVRVGVGVCRQPDEEGFRWNHTYRIVDHGGWTVARGGNWIEFGQSVRDDSSGYGYAYSKRLTLTPGSPELVIDHVVENSGRLTIETDVYNHNFFVIDGQATGPDFVVRFPFPPLADQDLKGFAEVSGKELTYLEEIPEGAFILTLLSGFSDRAEDHRFAIENRRTGAGVRMDGDPADVEAAVLVPFHYPVPRAVHRPEESPRGRRIAGRCATGSTASETDPGARRLRPYPPGRPPAGRRSSLSTQPVRSIFATPPLP